MNSYNNIQSILIRGLKIGSLEIEYGVPLNRILTVFGEAVVDV